MSGDERKPNVRLGRPDLSKDEVQEQLAREGMRVIETSDAHPRDEASDLDDAARLFQPQRAKGRRKES